MRHRSISSRYRPFASGLHEVVVPADEIERLRSFARSVDVMRRDLVGRGPSTEEWREWGRLCTFAHGVYGVYWMELLKQTAASADSVARLSGDARARDLERAVTRAIAVWEDGANTKDDAYATFIAALNDAGEAADDMGLLP